MLGREIVAKSLKNAAASSGVPISNWHTRFNALRTIVEKCFRYILEVIAGEITNVVIINARGVARIVVCHVRATSLALESVVKVIAFVECRRWRSHIQLIQADQLKGEGAEEVEYFLMCDHVSM